MVADNCKVPFKCRSCTAKAQPCADAINETISFLDTSNSRLHTAQLQRVGQLI